MGNCISFGRPASSKRQSSQASVSSPTNLLVQSPPAPIVSSSSVQFTIQHPSSAVTTGTPSSSGVSSASSTTSAVVFKSPQEINPRFQYVAIFDYDARTKDDLTIRKGDLLEITNKKNTAWWKAKNESGQEGWIPSNYVAKRDSLESEP
jgi:hypothetical protein